MPKPFISCYGLPMKNKKIIFIDLDGTLKNSQKQVTAATIEALVRAKAAGYEIVFATGRSFKYIETINRQANYVCRYAVASTGSIIYDLEQKQVLSISAILPKALLALCRTEHEKMAWLMHCPEGIYATKMIPELAAAQNGVLQPVNEPLANFLKSRKIGMIAAESPDFDVIQSMEPVIRKIAGIQICNRHKSLVDPSRSRSGVIFIDIVANDTSKGKGVQTLCDILGIPKENRIAIGDDINDLSMFAECGIGVAMGNALPVVKEHASLITDDNDHDGVAKFLNSLLTDRNIFI